MKHIIYSITDKKAVTNLNLSLLDIRDREFHWPKSVTLPIIGDGQPRNDGKPSDIKVHAVKYPVTEVNGIMITQGKSDLQEIGYNSLWAEQIDEITKALPSNEPRLT